MYLLATDLLQFDSSKSGCAKKYTFKDCFLVQMFKMDIKLCLLNPPFVLCLRKNTKRRQFKTITVMCKIKNYIYFFLTTQSHFVFFLNIISGSNKQPRFFKMHLNFVHVSCDEYHKILLFLKQYNQSILQILDLKIAQNALGTQNVLFDYIQFCFLLILFLFIYTDYFLEEVFYMLFFIFRNVVYMECKTVFKS